MPPVSAGTASDAALDALFVPFATGELTLPAQGGVLMLRAREGVALREHIRAGWVLQQSFAPAANALARHRYTVINDPPLGAPATFEVVLVLPTRQREETRLLFAQALSLVSPTGIVVASVPNAEGAKTAEADLALLAGAVGQLSKHKCRVFWTQPGAAPDTALLDEWLALDAPQPIAEGRFTSRRGLFAWDRIDTASALLASVLPGDLRGRVADLGAGFGYLACEVVERCTHVTSIDLFEAEGRAIEPARTNIAAVVARSGRSIATHVEWHDVTLGVDGRYDTIVSNPPFHQGRADQPELGRAFIFTAARALAPGGRFWMVANRHLAYEATLTACFGQVRTVVDRDGFKVIEAKEPRV
ncbi:class I SAM-dependent methyltransferase [Luteibacter aegosomaticola]|uniref:class I SAM-dependent methyltransferase n=1 Tax=Luteibacter aegosomaticola TaxID=2911538 RepID=UPI001FF8365A|nr:class I SAM-dependent methyltransferase [Luteibacter aegosomaticola]UPG88425.1 class I SAM-dependent methyltransferase [Luteibacter aegosomaticola]